MINQRIHLRTRLAVCAFLVFASSLPAAYAQTSTTPKSDAAARPRAAKPQAKTPPKKAAAVPPKIVYVPADVATPEQFAASEQVYYGVYECEFKQTVDISKSTKFPAYVDLRHGKVVYIMKPVLSSTGAIRLEDIRGETLMVQISSKSMLLNVKTAQRIVDDCVSPRQRELIDAARAAKAAAVASAAASAAEGAGGEIRPAETGLLRAPTAAAGPASAPR